MYMGNMLIDAKFREGEYADFDTAWDQAWDALSQVCQPERQVQGYEEYYFLAPEIVSELLIRAVEGGKASAPPLPRPG